MARREPEIGIWRWAKVGSAFVAWQRVNMGEYRLPLRSEAIEMLKANGSKKNALVLSVSEPITDPDDDDYGLIFANVDGRQT